MRIRPLYDRILAERVPKEEKTVGGLYIPANAEDGFIEALLVSVGTGKRLESGQSVPLSVKSGDRVLIGRYSGSEVMMDGKDHIILRENDILATISK